MSRPIQQNLPYTDQLTLVDTLTTTAAGVLPLALTGVEGFGGPTVAYGLTMPPWVFNDCQDYLSLTSGDDLTLVTFDIVGKDIYGNDINETVDPGPNAGTVTSTYQYAQITSITSNAAVTDLTITNSGTPLSRLIIPDYNRHNWAAAFQTHCEDATIEYDVWIALNPILVEGSLDPATITGLSILSLAPAADKTYQKILSFPITALWVDVGTASATDPLIFTFLQQGIS